MAHPSECGSDIVSVHAMRASMRAFMRASMRGASAMRATTRAFMRVVMRTSMRTSMRRVTGCAVTRAACHIACGSMSMRHSAAGVTGAVSGAAIRRARCSTAHCVHRSAPRTLLCPSSPRPLFLLRRTSCGGTVSQGAAVAEATRAAVEVGVLRLIICR